MSVEVTLLGPAEVPAADVVAVYTEAFGAAPYFEGEEEVRRFADDALPCHLERRDFRLALARSAEDGVVVGFAYGYTGEHGQWWHDWAQTRLTPAEAAEWVDGAFEMVELAVRPAAQRRGAGGRLHDALLAGLPNRTALLSTRDSDTPARRLYTRRGWVTLREKLQAGPGRPGVLLMGLRLPA